VSLPRPVARLPEIPNDINGPAPPPGGGTYPVSLFGMLPLTVVCSRRRVFLHAGKSRLSTGFTTEAAALAHLEKNRDFFAYWAGSASVSVDNTPARVIYA